MPQSLTEAHPFLAFRTRWAGTVQDICAALAVLSFFGGVGFWAVVLS